LLNDLISYDDSWLAGYAGHMMPPPPPPPMRGARGFARAPAPVSRAGLPTSW